MAVALTANFGSVQRWKDEFAPMGCAQSDGSGWVLLTFRRRPRRARRGVCRCVHEQHPLGRRASTLPARRS
ncbi:Fe-Mn family superoxide dismutase [Variovorax sp. ZT4R33]|uniref:Fe-Mn family superoxide dismutase n=1 Tax=Variovorax sp. ZT4R33 TaxID=3443743 RepID=UPI003F46B0BB